MALKVKTYNNVQANVTFSKASSRVEINPTAGAAATENIALTLGKISKWYDSLVPTGGSSGKILVYNSSGTAKWNDPLHPTITKSADTTSTASPAHGGTFTTVDSVTRDANGHVTKINTKTVTLPSDQNTDTKVNVTLATTTKAYLLGTSTTPTGTAQAVTSLADTGVYLDTTAGRLTTGSLWSNGDITLYTSGTGNSPAIFFRRGTLIDSSLDWKLYDTEGRLHFDRNISGSTESWENILKLDPTNSKMYFKNTEVSLAGHTHNYVPNTQAGMNTAINLLGTGTSDPQLADYYIAQYAGGGTTTTTYHRRPISALWNTFRALITSEVTGSGNAITTASFSNDGNNRKLTLTKGATFLTAHPTIPTSTDTTDSSSTSHGGTFTAITSVTRDTNGHVTKVNTRTYTLPSDNNTTYAFATGDAVGQFKVKASTASSYTNYNVNGISAGTDSGTANLLAYYSTATKISSTPKMAYHEVDSTASTPVKRNILHLFGEGVGNDAPKLISGTVGIIGYGDGGPQINFNTASSDTVTGGQNGAIIFTDHDSAAAGVSWHFVSDQTDWNVISKRFHAKTSISIGTDKPPSTTYTFYVTGSSYYTGDIVIGTSGSSSNDTGDIIWKYGNGNEKARIWFDDTYTAKQGPRFRLYKSDGTSLYSGYLPLADGTSASGTWGISITGTAASANKLNTNAGNTSRPVYFSGGIPIICDTPVSGKWWNGVPYVGNNGVLEIGKYIDFHATDTSTADYTYRFETTSNGLTATATGSYNTLTMVSPDYSQIRFQTTASGKGYTAGGIIAYPLTTSGMTMVIRSDGNTVVGGGESASTLYTNSYDNIDTAENETLYLASDSNEIHLITNVQAYSGRKVLKISDGQLVKSGGLWIAARDTAPVYANKPNAQDGGYYPAWFAKSKSGGWSMGVLSAQDNLYITYTTDADYSADPQQNQNTYLIQFQNKSGTVALTSDIPTVPTVNNASLTLKGAGTTVTTFTANASTNQSLDIVAGTNVTITPDATNHKITIASSYTNTTYTLGTSGNNVTLTPSSGSVQSITVPYATNAGNAYATVTNGTTTTTRYGVVFAADPNTSENNTMRKTYDFRINLTNGSTSTTGLAELVLGNANAKNTADNKQGSLTLYSSGTSYHQIYAAETNSAIAHTLPATSGTILNSGTTSFTRSLTSGTKIGTLKINGTSTDLYCQTNSNTTYTLGTSGDNVTLTPSSGSVQSITVPYATSSKEAYLRWGGKDFTGDCSPVDQAMVASLSPNRLELTRASGITIERSTNTGSSWSAVTMTDGEKRMMTSIAGPAMKVTTTDTRGMNANAAKYLLRITLDASSGVIYSLVNKFVTKITTSGSSGCYVKIYRRTVENAASGTDTWQVWNKTSKSWVATTDSSATDANTKNYLDGWFGFNVVNFTEFKIGTTTNAGQYRNVRFVFGAEANNNPADSSHSVDTYGGMSVYNVLMYGGFGWGTPSNLANTGHLYSWDGDEKATFPAEIKVPTQMRIFAASYGMIIRNDNTNTYFLPTAANDPQGSWRSPDSSYQFPLYINNSSGKVTMGNNVEIVGSLILSKTQDAVLGQNKYPALIVGGAPTDAHLELDGNEIMAKSNGTTGASLYLNSENGAGYVFINDGYAGHFTATPTSGQIVVTDGTTGGIKSSGYSTSSFLSSSTKYALSSSVGGAALSVSTQGGDVVLGTTGTSSNDSGDIVWKYGTVDSNNNPIEKARLWTANEYTAKSGPNYRVYKSDGTLLYNGTLPLADGTGASGSWSINASTATRSSYIDIVASNEVRFSVATKPANATDIHIGHAWSDGTSDAKINSYIFKNGGGGLALIKSKGYYLVDSGGNTYTGLYDNGTNLWIGSTQTQAKHHIGQTYISAGYNSTDSTGNSTIYISVPTDANNNGTNYAALHAGNFTTTGSGNAITSVAFTNEKLTFTKGSTFSLSTHTHNYAGSASAGGPANSVATVEANANADRVVFFADNSDTKKLVYDNDFKYNPSTNELTAQKFKGSLLRYHPSADLSKAGGDTTVSVTEYPSYTFSYVQTPAIFGGTDGRMGDSSGNWWAHYAVMSHGSGNSQYRYILRFPFWGAPQYQRPSNTTSNERWRNILTDETGAGGNYFLAYPADGYYYSHGNATGAIDITLPVGPGMMLSFSVDIWDYSAGKSCTYKIAGYGYAQDNKWYSTTAYCIGKPTHSMAIPVASSGGQTEITNLNVRFGYNSTSGKLKVQIGETDTSWSYLAVQIHDVTFCYGTTYFSTVSKGWSIGLVTSNIPNVSSTVKATNIAYHASAIALTHGNECNFTGPSSGTTNIWFGYRKADVNGTETNTAYISRYLFGNGNNTAVAGITCGDIIINTATTGTPTLSFVRGTQSDNYYDWRIRDDSGALWFDVNISGTWTSRGWFPADDQQLTILGSVALKNGSYVAKISPSSMSANRTFVLPNKSGGLPVSNILYENSTGTQSPVVAEAKGYKYFIVTVYHGALGEQTAIITPNQTITDHCYFSWTRIDDSQAASLRVAGAHIKVEPASSTNSITFTVYISDRHILAPGNSSTISSVATSGTPVIRKIIGFM